MQAGQLRDRINIQRRTGATDQWGTPLPDNWEFFTAAWANIRYQSGSESIKAGADVSIVRASIRIRSIPGIDAGMRVVHAGQVYDIEAVLPGVGRQHVDLVCRVLPVTDAPVPPEPEPDPGDGGWG